MGRLRTAAVECSYKEVYRQLKEQIMHELMTQKADRNHKRVQ